jgi:hypothetical protein
MADAEVHIAYAGEAPYDCVSCPAGTTVGTVMQQLQQGGYGQGIFCHFDNMKVGNMMPGEAQLEEGHQYVYRRPHGEPLADESRPGARTTCSGCFGPGLVFCQLGNSPGQVNALIAAVADVHSGVAIQLADVCWLHATTPMVQGPMSKVC